MSMINFHKLAVSGGTIRKTPASHIIDKVFEAVIESSGGETKLRPSGLPTCPFLLLDELYDNELESSSWDIGADYFTGVGHHLHKILEEWIPHAKQKDLWGNWGCPKCEEAKKEQIEAKLFKDCPPNDWGSIKVDGVLIDPKLEYRFWPEFTTQKKPKKCPKCGHKGKFLYKEVRVKYRDIFSGYIDLCLERKDGSIHLIDYKTYGKYKIDMAEVKFIQDLPKGYIVQLLTYCVMLRHTYGLKASKLSLLFFARDTPYNRKEFSMDITEEMIDEMELFLYDQRRYLRNAKRIFFKDKGSKLPDWFIQDKPCGSEMEYQELMAPTMYGGCPLASSCAAHPRPEKAIKLHFNDRHDELMLSREGKV